jgi:hypothetical protein
MNFRKRTLSLTLFLLTGHFSMSAETKQMSPNQYNVIIIMADDLGYSDIGCFGGEKKHPILIN